MDRKLDESGSGSGVIPFKTIAAIQMSSASVSFIASSVMAAMIIRGEKRLSTPYRRIIFVMCVADILVSFTAIVGPFAVPDDTPSSWGIGNESTCRTAGFFGRIGHNVMPPYTCFLCWYYLCKLKYRMTNDAFAQRIEWKVHAVVGSYILISSLVLLGLDTFHATSFRTSCQIAVTPVGCRIFPQVVGECDPVVEERVNNMIFVNHTLKGLYLIGMIVIMGMLYLHVVRYNRIFHPGPEPGSETGQGQGPAGDQEAPALSVSTRSDNDENDGGASGVGGERRAGSNENENEDASDLDRHGGDDADHDDHDAGAMANSNNSNHDDGPEIIATAAAATTRVVNHHHNNNYNNNNPRETVQYLSKLYRNEIALQGTCYVGAYCLTYLPGIVIHLIVIVNKGSPPPKPLQLLTFILVPLGGLFLMMAYTRPQIAHLRRENPGRSLLKCIGLVIRAGGDVPDEPANDDEHYNYYDSVDPRIRIRGGGRFIRRRWGLRGPRPGPRTRLRQRVHHQHQHQQQSQSDEEYYHHHHHRDQDEESISSVQIGADNDRSNRDVMVHGHSVATSVLGRDGGSLSIMEGQLNYCPESDWSYMRGGGDSNGNVTVDRGSMRPFARSDDHGATTELHINVGGGSASSIKQ